MRAIHEAAWSQKRFSGCGCGCEWVCLGTRLNPPVVDLPRRLGGVVWNTWFHITFSFSSLIAPTYIIYTPVLPLHLSIQFNSLSAHTLHCKGESSLKSERKLCVCGLGSEFDSTTPTSVGPFGSLWVLGRVSVSVPVSKYHQ